MALTDCIGDRGRLFQMAPWLLAILGLLGGWAQPLDAGGAGGIEGTFEYVIDVPWRIEPVQATDGSGFEFGSVPILITIHDAMDVKLDWGYFGDLERSAADILSLGNFCSLTVHNGAQEDTYVFDDLAEVELTRGRWPFPDNGAAPAHELCRSWQGEDCSGLRDLSESSEWHAVQWHPVTQQNDGEPIRPGSLVDLNLEVKLTRYPSVSCEEAAASVELPPAMLTLSNRVRVRFAEAPLPRFGEGWVYGDLHYHSQGTDNEGESGIAYRSVIRAMGAMGLDFALATEHASDSEQVIDADISAGLGWNNLVYVRKKGDTLRDMNRRRFAVAHGLIQGADGVNAEAALEAAGSLPQNVLGHGVIPQLLLGGEIDAIPEVAPGQADQYITYGNGLRYNPSHYLCKGWHGELWAENCDTSNLWEVATGGVLVKDAQGLNEYHYGREHMVYMPTNSSLEQPDGFGGTESAFVSSQTGEFGGAQRRLSRAHLGKQALLPEVSRKGFAFLAHPLNAPRPGSEGPDGVPWSEHMLSIAFESPGILGLQMWNENSRRSSSVHSSANYSGGPAMQIGYSRLEGLGAPKPSRTFRSGFATNSGLFDLAPWDPESGEWDKHSKKRVARGLQESSFTWDKMLHWGLDPIKRGQISWLQPGEPRRWLMAGGSDAHGDLNYHRSGYFNGTTHATDGAIGSPRNLVFLGAGAGTEVPVPGVPDGQYPVRYEHGEIVAALGSGNFAVTDGPALRMVVDTNGNGQIDDTDAPMGSVLHLTPEQTALPLLVEWQSTEEFGPVSMVDFYLGVQNGELGRTYAPYRHGPRGRLRGVGEGIGYPDSYGLKHELLDDRYWHLEETSLTRLRISGGTTGAPLPMCEAKIWTCESNEPQDLPGGDPTSPPNFPLCRTLAYDVPCTECSGYQLLEGYSSCLQTEILPPEDLPLPNTALSGTLPLDLDLAAFEAAQNFRGESFYVRAFVRTQTPREMSNGCYRAGGVCNCDVIDGECIERYAFTNPIWVMLDKARDCDEGDPDSDSDGIPDGCDPCPFTDDDVCLRE
ncbi:MAG: hypothetical protein K0U98_01440 [Deltaproteobacteria bacterium]|nr:hypothetical protein [Deltaproteobacteria bacterium]